MRRGCQLEAGSATVRLVGAATRNPPRFAAAARMATALATEYRQVADDLSRVERLFDWVD
jgi:hypothetical protein